MSNIDLYSDKDKLYINVFNKYIDFNKIIFAISSNLKQFENKIYFLLKFNVVQSCWCAPDYE